MTANSGQFTKHVVELASRQRCAWHRCRGPIQCQRASRRYCSGRCRMAAHRAGAHQLRRCTVELVSRREARQFILRHEALGTCGNAWLWFGLRDPRERLLSFVGFGHGAHSSGGCIVLERGATWRRAPHNAASYLISRALRYGRRNLGWQTVKAYSDPRFGEAGRVYKAVGFRQCPPSKHRTPWRYALQVGNRVLSDRAIYRRHGSHAAARAAGSTIVKLPPRTAWQWTARA
jgi:hypothetical protein